MSEYSNFLSQFNKAKNRNSSSGREDVIPLKNGIGSENKAEDIPFAPEEEKKPEEEEKVPVKTEETAPTEEATTEEEEESTPAEAEKETAPAEAEEAQERFIKTDDTPFISVRHAGENQSPTSVEKYTDRLVPRAPGKKAHTGYTGKINTYAANHSSDAASVKFIPASDEEKQEAVKTAGEKETPSSTARSQTKIIPTSVDTSEAPPGEPKVIVEKLGGDAPTKPIEKKGDLLREIAKSSGAELGEDPDQISMEEAAAGEENAAEEEVLEKELKDVREKRIKDFHFWSDSADEISDTDDETYSTDSDSRDMPGIMAKIEQKFRHLNSDFVSASSEEFTDPMNRRRVFSNLIKDRKTVIIKAAVLLLLGVILFIMNISASVSAALNNGFFTVFGSNTIVYNTVNLVFLIAGAVLTADDLQKGFNSLLKLRPKTDSVLLFMFVSAFAENIAAFFTLAKSESDYHMLNGAVLLLCVPLMIAKVFFHDSTRQCFKAVSAGQDKTCLRKIADRALVVSLLRDDPEEETDVVYPGKTRFVSNFIKRSGSSAFAAEISSKVIAAAAVLSFGAAIAAWVISKSFIFGLSTLTLCACLSLPVSCLLSGGLFLSKENEALAVRHSFIQSYSDARDFNAIDDIIMKDSEIFSAEIISSASASGVSQKQAEYCAAVLASKTQGLINTAFADIAAEYEDMIPETEKLLYEEKLGFSAWIKDCRVLLGSKDFLINHSIELPDEKGLPILTDENSRPLYLAIEGHFAAVFSIKYSCDKAAAETLRTLTKGGTNILLTTSDPNIDETFSEKLLGLPSNSLRITDRASREKLEAQRNTVTDSEEAGIIFAGSADSFLRIAASAVRLDKTKRLSKLITQTVTIVSILLVAVLAGTGSVAAVSVWLPVLLQILWGVICIFAVPLCLAPDAPGTVKKTVNRTVNKPVKKPVKEKAPAEDAPAEKKEPEKEAPAKDGQLKMDLPEEKPFEYVPPVIDFSKITGEEEEEEDGELPELTVTEEMLAEFTDTPDRTKKRRKAEKPEKKHSFLSRFEMSDGEEEEKDGGEDSFYTPEVPPPPRYELRKDKKKEEEDPLDVSFVPPESTGPTAVYDDDYFAMFEPREDKKRPVSIDDMYDIDDGDL